MKIPATERLIVEDFPEQKTWIAPMFSVLNRFITNVYLAINGGLVFSVNITGQELLFDFVYSSATASFPKKIKWKLADKPRALYVVEATEETGLLARTPVMVLAAWEFADDGTVSITSMARISTSGVAALTSGYRYKIRVRVTP